jgi:DNA-binding GntR family transcriptional regulator
MATSLADQAYEGLLTAISEGRLTPGQAIRETALAEELGYSRTPIR